MLTLSSTIHQPNLFGTDLLLQLDPTVAVYHRGIVGHFIAKQKIKTETIRDVNLQKESVHLMTLEK